MKEYDVRNVRAYYDGNYCGMWTVRELAGATGLWPADIIQMAKAGRTKERLKLRIGAPQQDTIHNQRCRKRLKEMIDWCKDIPLAEKKEPEGRIAKERRRAVWERHTVKDKPKMTECPYYLNDSGREARPWLNR